MNAIEFGELCGRHYRCDNLKEVMKVLRNRRIDIGLSYAQLAALTGIDRSNIGAYEKGRKNPSLSVVTLLAKELAAEVKVKYTLDLL